MQSMRPARSVEAERLAEIGLLAWETAITSWGESADSLRENARVAYLHFCVNHWTDILVADWDGEPVGWGACEKADDLVTDLWVLPEFQGRGFGTHLLGRIEAQIATRGYHHSRLDTHARNHRAIKLYKELGYQVRAYAVAYSPPLDRDIDKVEMIKAFDTFDDLARAIDEDDGLYGESGR